MAEIVNERRRIEPVRTGTTNREPSSKSGAAARVINAIVGAWVFISAFIWPHSDSSQTNTWICGALVVLFALIAMRAPAARFVNTAIAVWLFITSFSFPHISEATVWNNWISAVVIFFVSLVPGGYVRGERGGARPRRLARA